MNEIITLAGTWTKRVPQPEPPRCPKCGSYDLVLGTEENCDNMWCTRCDDYTTDSPRLPRNV